MDKNKTFFLGLFKKVPKELKKDYESTRLEANIRRMLALSVYIILIQIVLSIISLVTLKDTYEELKTVNLVLTIFSFVLGGVFCVVFYYMLKGKVKNKNINWLLVNAFLYAYIASLVVYNAYDLMYEQGANNLIVAIIILGLFPIFKPLHSLINITVTTTVSLILAAVLPNEIGRASCRERV